MQTGDERIRDAKRSEARCVDNTTDGFKGEVGGAVRHFKSAGLGLGASGSASKESESQKYLGLNNIPSGGNIAFRMITLRSSFRV